MSRGDGGCVRRRTAWFDVRHKSGDDEVCGKTRGGRVVRRGRIAQGKVAEEGAHPWYALIAVPRGKAAFGFCGGSLIDKRWIVTAAHCLVSARRKGEGFNQTKTRVYLGTNDCTGIGGIERRIVKVIRHDHFNHLTFNHDIALLKLDEDVTYDDDKVVPICLQSKAVINAQFINRRKAGFVIGCGAVVYKGSSSQRLMQVMVPLRARSECRGSTNKTFTENMICAGYTKATQGDSCSGDSGGPLAMTYKGQSVLVGIVSWGIGCDQAGKYGFYTNAGRYYDWINEKMANDEMQSDEEKQ